MTGPFPSGGTSSNTATNTPMIAESAGGESELQIDGLDIVTEKIYRLIITATNNDAASRDFTITANNGAIALASFNLGNIGSSTTFDISLYLNSSSDGTHYLANRIEKIDTNEVDGYTSAIANLTSIELNAVTAGSIGDNSFIKIVS